MNTVWQSLPSYVLVALAAAGLVYGLHRHSMRAARQRYAQLQGLMQQRTRELQNSRQQANDTAEAKTLFMANMSHEIRTPMNAIIGLAHLVQNTELSARQQDYMKKIERSGRHLLGVLNDILDFSKVEAGMLSIDSRCFELDTLLQEVVTMVAPLAYDKGLEFICVADAQLPRRLLGDPLRLTQVLINFLDHAIKQTAHGEVTLHVEPCALPQSSDAADSEGLGVRFTVQDSGSGLSPEQCAHLFDGYALQNAEVQRQQGARGLGLAVGKRLAELMGGSAGVSVVAGRSSTLWFSAWLQRDTSPAPAALATRSVDGLKALVVDDHPIAAQTIAELLKRLGLRVDVCHSGRDGLERIRQAERGGDAYGVVLLDWEMPEWDGLMSARHIAAEGLLQTPELIVVTGHSKDEIAKPAKAAGLHEILIKPVTASALFEALMRVIPVTPASGSYGRPACIADAAQLAGLHGAQVLLVEDNDINQDVACELLRGFGLDVDVAEDGQIALDCLGRKPYDLVLMDMHMPVMDGLTATRRLRADPLYQSLPIVAMTANAMQSDRDRCLAAGMNGYIAKPIDPELLKTTLLQWIKPRALAQTAYK